MNYSKLKDIITKQNYSIGKISFAIGRTEAWFHKAVKNDTMTIADLEKILKICKMELSDFFGNSSSNNFNSNEPDFHKKYNTLNDENNELLRENRQLRIKIETLEERLKTKEIETYKINE
jgi:hypothetical protein